MNFMEFFIEESCGSCVPCRVLTTKYRDKLRKVIDEIATEQDLEEMANWAYMMKANRCGLGQTAINPILTSLKNFRGLYEKKLKRNTDYSTGFNLQDAVQEAAEAAGRKPYFVEH